MWRGTLWECKLSVLGSLWSSQGGYTGVDDNGDFESVVYVLQLYIQSSVSGRKHFPLPEKGFRVGTGGKVAGDGLLSVF